VNDHAELSCPQCRDTAFARKVTALMNEGTSTTTGVVAGGGLGAVLGGLNVGTTSTALSQKLTPPAEPRQPLPSPDLNSSVAYGCLGGALAFTATMFGLIGLAFGISERGLAGIYFAGGLTALAVWGAIAAFRKRDAINKEQDSRRKRIAAEHEQRVEAFHREHEQWERQTERWQKLFYCARCDGVFLPGEDALIPVDRMNTLLNA
jgi:hypothetical protein